MRARALEEAGIGFSTGLNVGDCAPDYNPNPVGAASKARVLITLRSVERGPRWILASASKGEYSTPHSRWRGATNMTTYNYT
jgi:hypothetical protein